MKKLLILVMAGFLTCCGSHAEIQSQFPFTIQQSSFQNWVGGREESGSGTEINIKLLGVEPDIYFENIFFRDKKTKVNSVESNGIRDLTAILNGNTTTSKVALSFKLDPNDAVLSYKQNNKLYYIKVEELKEKQTKLFKSLPRN